MRASLLLVALAWAAFGPPARAADYAKVDRTLRKEPAYQKAPKYALLLFGPEAALRVWVVFDGQTVYLDRNGDGDLTGADKRFASADACRDVEIADPDGKTRYIIRFVSLFKGKDEKSENLDVDIEVQGPVSYRQYCGVELKDSAREAHIAHFHGPLTMGPLTVYWKVPEGLAFVTGDKPTDLRGHVGTMDAQSGCWVVVRSHIDASTSAFPKGVFPVVDVEFPPKAAGGAPVKKRYELDHFC
jgi:hypothetical protein